ncbi:MAG: dihydrofolate reductase family protein [Synergistota bacterium]|nr:dihydrofolate reductase family protein [Synergistota bacterium]
MTERPDTPKRRPVTTLFMLSTVDGKISTGASDLLDVDKDFPNLEGVGEGLNQYYDIEQTTDLWSINSGRVQAKIGTNEMPPPKKTAVSFVIIDNVNMSISGIKYFCDLSKEFVLVTTNPSHPAYSLREDNLHIIHQAKLDLRKMLEILYERHGCRRVTIQTGGTLNGLFLREKLIDHVDIVLAPVLVGGKDTPTLIDGKSLLSPSELGLLGVLVLEKCDILDHSYVRLRYKVIG